MSSSTSGVRASIKKGGVEAEVNWTLADMVAAAAIPTGLLIANLDSPLPGPADLVGIPIALGGLAYFGVKARRGDNKKMIAQANPDDRVWTGLAVLVLGGGAWAVYRIQQRKKLEKELEDSPTVRMAADLGLLRWTPEEKAAELMPLLESKGVDAALLEAVTEVQTLLASQGLGEGSASTKAKQYIEAKTGVDLDPYMDQARETTREGWDWVSSWWTDEPEAKENPSLSWSQYLADLE